jgi:hypothetical protein
MESKLLVAAVELLFVAAVGLLGLFFGRLDGIKIGTEEQQKVTIQVQAELAAEKLAAAQASLEAEHQILTLSTQLTAQSAQYEEEKSHAQDAYRASISGLANGNIQLRAALAIATHAIRSLPTAADSGGTAGPQSASADTGILAPEVASRLESIYVDWNERGRLLNDCEAALSLERSQSASQPETPQDMDGAPKSAREPS